MEQGSTEEEEARAIELDAFEVSTRSLSDGSHILEVKARIGKDLIKPSLLIGEKREAMGILTGRLIGQPKIRIEVVSWALYGGEPGKGS
jgi:hypothetical protein